MGSAVKVNLPQTPAKGGNLGLPMGNNDKMHGWREITESRVTSIISLLPIPATSNAEIQISGDFNLPVGVRIVGVVFKDSEGWQRLSDRLPRQVQKAGRTSVPNKSIC